MQVLDFRCRPIADIWQQPKYATIGPKICAEGFDFDNAEKRDGTSNAAKWHHKLKGAMQMKVVDR